MSEAFELFAVMMAVMLPVSLIVFINQYFKYKSSVHKKLGALHDEISQQSTAELELEVAALKERIVVLERIVTDRGFELNSKISNL